MFTGLTLHLRHALLSAALLAGGVFCAASISDEAHAQAQPVISVHVDEARVVWMKEPVATVIVGNPTIADVHVQSSKVLIVTGKSFGTTNLIVLDAKGSPILNRRLDVRANHADVVTLRKGPLQLTYNCSPVCLPALTLGDSSEQFEVLKKQIEGKTKAANEGASGSRGAQ